MGWHVDGSEAATKLVKMIDSIRHLWVADAFENYGRSPYSDTLGGKFAHIWTTPRLWTTYSNSARWATTWAELIIVANQELDARRNQKSSI
jgi:hypothetical protein